MRSGWATCGPLAGALQTAQPLPFRGRPLPLSSWVSLHPGRRGSPSPASFSKIEMTELENVSSVGFFLGDLAHTDGPLIIAVKVTGKKPAPGSVPWKS